MEIGPILRAMLRNKLGTMLIALQIAFTMTVIVNAISIVEERTTLMAKPSGLDEENLFHLTSIGFGPQFNEVTSVADDLNYFRSTPGIIDATPINAIPVGNSGSSTGVRLDPDITKPSTGAAIYRVDEHAISTLGLELIAGEDFTAADVRVREPADNTVSPKTIISEALAERLFPGEALNAVGKTIYQGIKPMQITGIVKRLQAPWPNSGLVERSMMVPENVINGNTTYLIRTEPGERDRLMIEVEEYLAASSNNRIIRDTRSLVETREETFRLDGVMRTILNIVIGTLIFITSMGIVGLAVFGINKRKKQIGTRRALGATRLQILRYFLLENFFVTCVGVAVGGALTAVMSYYLSTNFNMTPIDLMYIAYGMLALITVGQLSVFGPSASAAQVAPAVATRTI